MQRAAPSERCLVSPCACMERRRAARVAAWTRSLLFEGTREARLALFVLLCGDRAHADAESPLSPHRPPDRRPLFSLLRSVRIPRRRAAREFLGDLVIDVPYAARQARRRGHALRREVQILLAHGLLHLLGYDHETDGGTMFRLQRRLLLSAFGEGPDGVP